MIICRSKGFIFLRVPKTASSSLSAHICDYIKFDHKIDAYSKYMHRSGFNINHDIESKNEHATLLNFLRSGIIKEQDINNLKVYGVLREPVERTISMFSHLLSDFVGVDISEMTNSQIVEEGLKVFHSSPKKYFFSRYVNDPNNVRYYPLLPQSNWLIHFNREISNIIVYPNFSKFLFDITSNVNLMYEFNKLNYKKPNKNIGSDLVTELRKIYPQDFVLWEKYGMK